MAILKPSGVNREVPDGFYKPSGVIPDPVGFFNTIRKNKNRQEFPRLW
jgi:hypothetical protein